MYKLLFVPGDLASTGANAGFVHREDFRIRTAPGPEEASAICLVWSPDLVLIGERFIGAQAEQLATAISTVPRLASCRLLLISNSGAHTQELHAPWALEVVPAERLAQRVTALLQVSVRRGERIAVRLLARTSGLSNEQLRRPLNFANVTSLSESGLRLETAQPLDPGARGEVVLMLPGGEEPLALPCVVHELVDADELCYALEFVDAPAAAIEEIRRFIASKTSASG